MTRGRSLRIGAVPWIYGGVLVLLLATAIANLALRDQIFLWTLSFPQLPTLLAGLLGALELSLLGLGVGTIFLSRALQRGVPGQVRIAVMGTGGIVHFIANLALAPVLYFAFSAALLDPANLVADAFDLALGWKIALYGLLFVSGAGLLASLFALISCWFLIPIRTRRIIWNVVDAALLIAFVVTTLLFPITPADESDAALRDAAIRLAVTVLFALRVCARMLPPFLDVVESLGFHPLVAARHLRAKKSGFITVIGLLAITAVTVSSCALTTTLSVMGGFRNDLKRKILGSNAHVVIDRDHGDFEGWVPVLERARGVEGVVGVSPYVSGEVMVSSASNLGGAVLRGIDTRAIGNVTELPRMMRHGRLEYLERPEQLLDLPDEELRDVLIPMQTGSWRRRRDRDEPEAPASPDSLVRDLDLDVIPDGVPGNSPAGGNETRPQKQPSPADDFEDFFRPSEGPRRDVLPGVIIGQELARTLRVFLGDEVNVVSPLGDLGPAGPMPKSRPFRVAGIFYSGMYEYDMKYCYVTLETAQRFLGTGDAISGIEVKVRDIDGAPVTASAIRRTIGRRELRVRDWQEMNRQLFGALELEKLSMSIFLGMAILVAGFCVFATLGLMVQEKGREVSILKAMGTSDRGVVGVFLIEGLLIGVFGAALGTGLGWVMCFVFEHFGVKMNPEVYYIDKLPVHIDPTEFTFVAVASVVICLLATAYPAISASWVQPSEQLKDQ
jgi:lipoprotein-releasing system permease protein